MASQPRKGGVSLPERRAPKTNGQGSLITRLSNSPIVSRGKQAAGDAVYVSKRLLRSTGKAAWIAGTTFLILVVPLIVEMDREQQLNELDLQQASLLGAPPVNPTLDHIPNKVSLIVALYYWRVILFAHSIIGLSVMMICVVFVILSW